MKKGAVKKSGPEKKPEVRSFKAIIATFLIACVVITALCMVYYGQLQDTIQQESGAYLGEISMRIGNNIDKIIEDTYAMLRSIASMVRSTEGMTFLQLRSLSLEQQSYWGYQNLLLIDGDGTAYDVNGKSMALSGEAYLREAVVSRNASMSPLQVINGVECAVFVVPLERVRVEGIDMAAIAVAYDTANFARVLSMSAFSGKASCYIISMDGNVIIRSEAFAGQDIGYNVFSSIEASKANDRAEIERMREDIMGQQVGQGAFILNGVSEYIVYSPVKTADWYLLTFIPVETVNARSNILLSMTLVIAVLITLSFAALTVILVRSYKAYNRRLERIAYVDEVTGGNTIDRFYELAGAALAQEGHPGYALVYTNLTKFKVLNETFGRRVCDEMLKVLYQSVSETLTGHECMGRMMADNFCVLIHNEDLGQMRDRFAGWYASVVDRVVKDKLVWTVPGAEFGVYTIHDDTLPFPQMIDRAKLSLNESPVSINTKLRYAVYSDEMRRKLFREKQLEDMMEDALSQGEFQVYFQPKFRASDEKIVGAEALCRWMNKVEGMIYPNEFIPLFEKNGFIVRIDLWVFEQVCIAIQDWIKRGIAPVKISINCSRIHFKDVDFLLQYRKLAEKYNVPGDLIEIELTESIILEDSERFRGVVEEIHEAGFACSMDDFGSGYSSLNMIQDIAVDTLKLDKIFFRDTMRDPRRTQSVVSNIIGMAKALSMETVAEGVEKYDQVVMLRAIGCDMIQGYVFAKPMPMGEFEKLMKMH